MLLTNVTNSQFFLNDTAITISNSVKYLGVNLYPDLNWNNHINNKLGKSMRSFCYIKRTVPFSAPVKTKISVYVACVQSILLYNSCVWNPKVTLPKKMEKLHKKAKKLVFGRDNYVADLLTLRILPICYQNILNDLVLFSKLLQNRYDFNIFIKVSYFTHERVIGLAIQLCSSYRKSARSPHGEAIFIGLWRTQTMFQERGSTCCRIHQL